MANRLTPEEHDFLRQHGVSDADLRAYKDGPNAGWRKAVVMFPFFAWYGLIAWATFASMDQARALSAAYFGPIVEAQGALFWDNNPGWSALAGFFAGLVAPLTVIGIVDESPEARRVDIINAALQVRTANRQTFAVRKCIERLKELADPREADAARQAVASITRIAAAVTLVLAGVAGFGFYAETRSGVVFTPDGVDRYSLNLASERPVRYGWDQLETIELGCNHHDDGDTLIYRLRFADGWSISPASPPESQRPSTLVFDRYVQLDEAIGAAPGVYERWSHMNRNPVHPDCFARWSQIEGRYRLAAFLKLDEEDRRRLGVPDREQFLDPEPIP